MNKPALRLDFCDFWGGFDKKNNFFYKLLSARYDIAITQNPDFLIHSCFGRSYRKYDCVRIFYTGENIRPDFSKSDYSFSFDLDDFGGRNCRLPLYALYADVNLLTREKDIDEIVRTKTKFCNFVVSNVSHPDSARRIDFFHKLSKYKKVDSGGKYMNNVGGPVEDKIEFLKSYKFSIAFENTSYPGYTTEKVFEPMLVNSVPIYWGSPLVDMDFNARSFINCHEYESDDAVIDRIVAIDSNESLYREYLAQPYFEGNSPNRFVDKDLILDRFAHIFARHSGQAANHRRRGWPRRRLRLFI